MNSNTQGVEKTQGTEHLTELVSLEENLRKEVGGYSPSKLNQAARWIERTSEIHRRLKALRGEIVERIVEGRALLSATSAAEPPGPRPESERPALEIRSVQGGKARGRECRAAYVDQQAKDGRTLLRFRGALYKNTGGETVGIAYAREKKSEWFLGLPAGEFHEAVLLCEADDGLVQPIRLPRSFIETYGKRLSVSSQYNQAKFNVRRRVGRYCLIVSGEDLDLTDYAAGQPLLVRRREYA